MFFRIYKLLFPMDKNIDNATYEVYKTIHNITLSIYLVLLQIIYLNEGWFRILFKNEDVADFIFGLLISATVYSVIYFFVSVIHRWIWIKYNLNKCYLSGTWYHVFERRIDDDKDYVRAGWITISQNYYDLRVEAYNYNIFIQNGKMTYDQKQCSHWEFTLSELNKNGRIIACFSKDSGYTDLISKSGIMDLYTEKDLNEKRINQMYGTFADSGNSTVKGDIKLFRGGKRKEGRFDFLSCAPDEWNAYIRKSFKTTDTSFSLKQVVLDAAKMLPSSSISQNVVYEKDGKKNIVTLYDEMIQTYIMNRLLEYFPTATFLGEENLNTVETSDSAISFIIDPIDGTSNFVNDNKFSCIAIAMLNNGVIVESAIYNPYLDELFYARKGSGAWLNDKRIFIEDKGLSESIVGFTNCPYDVDMTDITFSFGKEIFKCALDLRRMGASALELCYAACGRYQLYCEMILYPWDYAAASLFVEESGGKISDLNGEKLSMNKRCSVVAGCPKAHGELLELYQKFIKSDS